MFTIRYHMVEINVHLSLLYRVVYSYFCPNGSLALHCLRYEEIQSTGHRMSLPIQKYLLSIYYATRKTNKLYIPLLSFPIHS